VEDGWERTGGSGRPCCPGQRPRLGLVNERDRAWPWGLGHGAPQHGDGASKRGDRGQVSDPGQASSPPLS
jgi:hypothetical protein